jgi:hypothetical protein
VSFLHNNLQKGVSGLFACREMSNAASPRECNNEPASSGMTGMSSYESRAPAAILEAAVESPLRSKRIMLDRVCLNTVWNDLLHKQQQELT